MKRLLCIATASLFLVFASHVHVRANTIVISPTLIDFGTVTIGQNTFRTVTGQVTFDGLFLGSSWSYQIIGGTMNPFDLSTTSLLSCNNSLKCTIAVFWEPTTPGSFNLIVEVTANVLGLGGFQHLVSEPFEF